MKVTIEQRGLTGNVSTLAVKGEIDIYTAPSLKEKLLPLTEKKGANVTLDLSGTSYIDSTALGVIVGALKSAEEHQCTFHVEGLTPRVERLFKITGLMDILKNKKLAEGDNQ
ncbi:anti-sigma factor antagonist [Sporolactobacillus sp. THM7-4]|nr:anti-sigma factor antagonist [Sporolactobacillus sp. THM7-4]